MKIVKSIELPADSNYKLTKISSLNKNPVMIAKNHSVIGILHWNLIKLGRNVIVVGNGFSNIIYTTEVTKIRVLKRKIVFHTLNSIYELKEVK